MVTVGITGGIGSGKTTVCKRWESLGATVIDADQLARDLMVKNPGLVTAIKKEFGVEAYDSNGNLNRPYLARQAFELNKVDTLNQLVHPEVYKETQRIMDRARVDGVEVLVKEAALLLLKGRPKNLDVIVLVLAEQDLRKQRVALRDKTSPDQVLIRMQRQQNFEKLENRADYVIRNDGSLKELIQQADEMFEVFLEQGKA